MREVLESFAPIFLAVALSFTAWASYKLRSRKYIFLSMIVSLGYLGFFHHGCVCSVGSIQNVLMSLLNKTYVIPFIISTAFILPLIAAFFWGRVFCGGVCPLGAMQDLVNVFRLKIPSWLNPILRLLPIIYLFLAAIFLINGAGFLICKYDPFISFIRLNGTFSMILLGVIGLLISMFIARPYCRYFCPYGVLLGWISRFSRKKVSITPTECEKCHLCKDACPVEAIEKPTALKSKEKQKVGLWWVSVFIIMIPLWMMAFGFVGARLSTPVKVIEKVEKLQSQQEQKFTSKRAEQIEELVFESHVNDSKGATTGVLFGWIWGLALISLVVRRERDEYTANASDCIVCGRCYNYCPVEVELREESKGKVKADKLLGHLADRFALSENIRKKLSIGTLISVALLFVSLFFLMGNLKDIESQNILKQKELSTLKVQIRKNPTDENLKKEFGSKEAIAQELYNDTIHSHKANMLYTLILLFLIAGILKVRKNLSEPLESIKEEPPGISPTFGLLTRLGAIVLGVVLIVLGLVFSVRPY